MKLTTFFSYALLQLSVSTNLMRQEVLVLWASLEHVPLAYSYLKATFILQDTYCKSAFPSILGLLDFLSGKHIEDYDTHNGSLRAENLHLSGSPGPIQFHQGDEPQAKKRSRQTSGTAAYHGLSSQSVVKLQCFSHSCSLQITDFLEQSLPVN